ncbi:MAG TPA: FtsQ-type POTRA domain-containing protein [Micropruina sp.]|nr:FtsQ-type POTRA domain-containing protein [Micropruina sp.]
MSTMTQVSDATDRITLRRRNDRRRRWLLAGIVALVMALLATLAWLVLGSDVLGVRTVAVSGNTITNTDDVRRLAELPAGVPLARVDLEGVATRVAGLPAVKTVKVAREWPNTVTVQITERSPLFAIETPGGYWIADDQGVVFKSSADADGLMVASVSNGDPRLIRDLGTVLSALPAGLRSRVDKVGADTVDSIVLYLPGGNRIVWGSADQSPLKAQVVVPLLKQQGTVYDVSAPSNPTIR